MPTGLRHLQDIATFLLPVRIYVLLCDSEWPRTLFQQIYAFSSNGSYRTAEKTPAHCDLAWLSHS